MTLALAVALALGTDVVTQHGAEDEVFFWIKLVQRTGDDELDGSQTLAASEIDVLVLLSGRLYQVGYALTLQALHGQWDILLVTGEQYHLAYAFVKFVDVVHQNLHLCGNH